MNAFRASLPGRIVSLSIAFALGAGGVISIFGLDVTTWLPWSLLIPIVGCLFGTILAVQDHTGAAAALLVALPLLLWPYVMGLIAIANSYPQMGWLLVAAGGGVAAFSAAGMGKPSEAPTAAIKQQVA